MDNKVSSIKKSQKESLFLKEFSALFLEITKDHPDLMGLFITRASLNDKKSVCTFYFYSDLGKEDFESKLDILKLYKPSIRTALAKKINARYTPEIRFGFDSQFEKELRVNALLDKVKKEIE